MIIELRIIAAASFAVVWLKRGQSALAAGIICAICIWCLNKRLK